MEIIKSTEQKIIGNSALIFGVPGSGKTTLASRLKGSTIVIALDPGCGVLKNEEKEVDIVKIKSDLSNLKPTFDDPDLLKYDNIIVDTITELEALFIRYYASLQEKETPTQADYYKMQLKLDSYATKLTDMQFQGKNVIMLAQEMVVKETEKDGYLISKLMPAIYAKDGKIAKNIMARFDIIGHIERKDGKEAMIRLQPTKEMPLKDRIYKKIWCTMGNLFGSEQEKIEKPKEK